MTPQQTQELKALLCEGCRLGQLICGTTHYVEMADPFKSGKTVQPFPGYGPCTANPAVIEWVEKQLEIAKGESR